MSKRRQVSVFFEYTITGRQYYTFPADFTDDQIEEAMKADPWNYAADMASCADIEELDVMEITQEDSDEEE